MSRDSCKSCGKPLGSTSKRCFECGGSPSRCRPRITADEWQVLLVGATLNTGGDA